VRRSAARSQGDSIDAFERWWNAENGPGRNLENAAAAVELIGAGLIAMAGITVALKIAFIARWSGWRSRWARRSPPRW
jgi:hypothetical protein